MPDTAPPPFAADADSVEVRRPPELALVLLGGLLLLGVLTACFVAAEIVLPFVLAFVLSAVFQPVLRALERIRLPRVLAALLIVLSLVAIVAVVGLLLAGPIAGLIAEMPQIVPKLQARLLFLAGPVRALQRAFAHFQIPGAEPAAPAVAVQPSSNLAQQVLQQVRVVAAGAFTTGLVLFFVLMSGEQFLRRLVEILPNFKAKRRAVDISQQIEEDISVYLATITLMNALVGLLTAGMAALCGLGTPLLWGTVAFLLNYVPVLGPTAGVVLFLVVGLVTIEPLWMAFVPAALYLAIHVAEGETVTPMLLAARFTLNPVLIVLGVIFWYWMWGVCGAILSTPMLAIVKIVCDRVDALKPFGHFIGAEPANGSAGNGKAAR
jgi:predicted PurR-regulated permease PerM